MQREGRGSMEETDMEINIKTDRTEGHTSGHNALAKMEHSVTGQYL